MQTQRIINCAQKHPVAPPIAGYANILQEGFNNPEPEERLVTTWVSGGLGKEVKTDRREGITESKYLDEHCAAIEPVLTAYPEDP